MVSKWAPNKTSLSHQNGEATESYGFQTDKSQNVSYDPDDITVKNLAEVYNKTGLPAGSWIDLTLLPPSSAFYPDKAEFTLQPTEQTRICLLLRQKDMTRAKGGRGWAKWTPFLLSPPGDCTPTLPRTPQTHTYSRKGKAKGCYRGTLPTLSLSISAEGSRQ